MNVIELNRINECRQLLDKVLDGKTEYLKELKQAKSTLDDLVEFKDIDSKDAWKLALD